jgi:cytochrome c peroxidase
MTHYVAGGTARPTRSPLMKPVALTATEVADVVAFLRTLSSPQSVVAMPNLPAH